MLSTDLPRWGRARVAVALLCAATCLVTAPSRSHATTFDLRPDGLDLESLARRSSVAAFVQVLDQSSRWEGTRIVTDSRVFVLDSGFGVDAGTTLTISSLGGFVGDIGQRVFGLEPLAPGDELAVLLTNKRGDPERYVITGAVMGMFRVFRGDFEPEPLAPLLGPTSAVRGTRLPAPVSLGDFMARVRAVRR